MHHAIHSSTLFHDQTFKSHGSFFPMALGAGPFIAQNLRLECEPVEAEETRTD